MTDQHLTDQHLTDQDPSAVPAVDPGMAVSTAGYAAPSPDRFTESDTALTPETLAEMRAIAARYPEARSGLLPMLHLVQSVEGRVTPQGIEACADILGISAAEVSGVATFYTMYKRKPVGDYLVGVCTNTLCAVMGGDLIFERLKEHLDVGNDETSERTAEFPQAVTLEHIECNAACDYAPVMMVNWEFMDNQTPQSAIAAVDDLRAGKDVHSTRGPRLCSWKQAERVLAGFPDDLADEGPSAGPASLVGLGIARERGWTAPSVTADQHDAGPEEAEKAAAGADGSHEAERQDDEGAVERSDADLKHEDDAKGTEEAK